MKMKRIDYLLNAKDPIKVLVEKFDLALDCCECQYDDECDGMGVDCKSAFIKYLKQDIEVNESDLKDTEISKEVEEKKEVENDNVKMKRIDYILNAKDNIQAILDETVLDCDICPGYCKNRKDRKDCDGDCEFYYKKYLNEEIEVDKSKLKLVEESIEAKTVERGEEVVNDSVNHPSHYTDGKIEVMDFVEDKQLNFARGNVIKYVSRAGKKDPNKELEDLNKAMWYLKREIERLKKKNN